jgi:hypothetical protein
MVDRVYKGQIPTLTSDLDELREISYYLGSKN